MIHRARVGLAVSAALLAGGTLAQELPGSDPLAREEARQLMGEWQEMRRAHAGDAWLSAAQTFLDPHHRSELVLISTMSEPVPVEAGAAVSRR